ncbi:unnamed protein product [Brassicogethes aeneus]|uniref:BolA-like protein 2 n=1 Tax=Brassicogethes aeneus TaxID=1431903 RepID=A0A9P0AW02_BRAAE|nr:unnamed protein product [Brassicogethes aeneus]
MALPAKIRNPSKILRFFSIKRLLSEINSPLRMVYTEEHLKDKLQKGLDATHVEVVDESDGCGGKFSCIIVSEKFKGKPLLQRHRLVNTVLQEELKTIHAFSQKTFTPEQWEENQN